MLVPHKKMKSRSAIIVLLAVASQVVHVQAQYYGISRSTTPGVTVNSPGVVSSSVGTTTAPTSASGASGLSPVTATRPTGTIVTTTPISTVATTSQPETTTYFFLKKPSPAPGAIGQFPQPYTSTINKTAQWEPIGTASGISWHNLGVAEPVWDQIKNAAAVAGNVSAAEGRRIFVKQVVYTMVLWHPEYLGAWNLSDPEIVWSDNSAFNASMDAYGEELDEEMVALITAQLNISNRIYDDFSAGHYQDTLDAGGKVWRTMAYFNWLSDAMRAATEFFMGDQLNDEEYVSIGQCFDYVNMRSLHGFQLYQRGCAVRERGTDFYII